MWLISKVVDIIDECDFEDNELPIQKFCNRRGNLAVSVMPQT